MVERHFHYDIHDNLPRQDYETSVQLRYRNCSERGLFVDFDLVHALCSGFKNTENCLLSKLCFHLKSEISMYAGAANNVCNFEASV